MGNVVQVALLNVTNGAVHPTQLQRFPPVIWQLFESISLSSFLFLLSCLSFFLSSSFLSHFPLIGKQFRKKERRERKKKDQKNWQKIEAGKGGEQIEASPVIFSGCRASLDAVEIILPLPRLVLKVHLPIPSSLRSWSVLLSSVGTDWHLTFPMPPPPPLRYRSLLELSLLPGTNGCTLPSCFWLVFVDFLTFRGLLPPMIQAVSATSPAARIREYGNPAGLCCCSSRRSPSAGAANTWDSRKNRTALVKHLPKVMINE